MEREPPGPKFVDEMILRSKRCVPASRISRIITLNPNKVGPTSEERRLGGGEDKGGWGVLKGNFFSGNAGQFEDQEEEG